MPFLRIPAGKFLMGSKEDNKLAYDDERPQHTLELPEFYVARFPVTNVDYARFPGANSKIPKGKENHPVVKVSWQDAMKYVQWLNETANDDLPDGYQHELSITRPTMIASIKTAMVKESRMPVTP